ncbi:hypothetical protein [Metabacillus idriensis]|uniref:hypothetical protein n=1 Tax=Metabacillus idriensis TaxID=324768 RepID=UPI001639EB75|nr:hypothetical protein [Metabacillus idriensis]QNG59162.1 hypothetical protein H4O14_15310 [Bacillus sp. PAMC26568]
MEKLFLDAGYKSSKLDEMVNKGIIKISFILESQIERLLIQVHNELIFFQKNLLLLGL